MTTQRLAYAPNEETPGIDWRPALIESTTTMPMHSDIDALSDCSRLTGISSPTRHPAANSTTRVGSKIRPSVGCQLVRIEISPKYVVTRANQIAPTLRSFGRTQ